MAYTKSQQVVIDKGPELLEKKGYLFINAPAGYGKTFIAKKLAPSAVLSATTHDAAKVLDPTAKTIHSLLGLAPRNDQLVKMHKMKLEKNQTVIIDEASMVGEELFSYIDAAKEDLDLKVIFLGDLKQLPPVNDCHPDIFFDDSLSMTLTEPVRQNLESDIFKLCTLLRERIEANEEVSYEDIEDFFGEEIKPVTFSKYLNKVTKENKLAAYTNYAVDKRGHEVHEKLHGKPLEESITELWMDVKNTPVPLKGTDEILFRDPVKVESIEYFGTVSGQKIYKVKIPQGKFYWTRGNMYEITKNLSSKVKAGVGDWTWQKYYKITKSFINLESPYSKTVHRFQGKTVDTIAIDWGNITKKRKTSNVDLVNKLLYVAVSRAKKEVEIIL